MHYPTRTEREDIVGNLLVLLDHLSDDDLELLKRHLLDNTKEPSLTELKQMLGLSGLPFGALAGFMKNASLNRYFLVLALQTAIAVRKHDLQYKDTCELIWTGPVQFPIPARSTMMIIKEMIESARNIITVVGYRVEEYAEPVVKLLYRALARGVQIILILDRAPDQISLFRKTWQKQKLPPVYTRKMNAADPMEALHAKLIIVDNTDLLITSANLTYHGLSANIEIGARIKGKTAHDAQLLVNALIRNGDLVGQKWD